MYRSIGADMSVRENSVIGIFDLDHCTCSARGRLFLKEAEQRGAVITVGDEIPRAFLLAAEYGMHQVYLTTLSSRALGQRFEENK